MREKRGAEPDAAVGTWLAPVEMPVQTYQWNMRAVPEPPPGSETEPTGGGIAVADPALDLPPPLPRTRVAPARTTTPPTYGGLALACVLALVMPLGLTFAVEGLAWHHRPGMNVLLVATVAITILVGSILIGLLAGELGRHRSVVRGLGAAGLAGITTVLLGLLVDVHPGKFGFSLGPVVLVALFGPLLAFVFASGIGTSR